MYSEDQEAVSSRTNGSSQPRGESVCVSCIVVRAVLYTTCRVWTDLSPSPVTVVVFCVNVCGPRFCYRTALIGLNLKDFTIPGCRRGEVQVFGLLGR